MNEQLPTGATVNGAAKPLTPDEERLVKLRARRAEIESAQAAREVPTIAEQLAAEERALAEAEAIERCTTEIGKVDEHIALVRTRLGLIILKRAHRAAFKRFQDKGEYNTDVCEKLVRPCVVYPESAAFDRITDELPATLITCANAVSRLAGVKREELAGK